jgi:L-iditol 2-dehydrogenase
MLKVPALFGHEMAGTVAEVGDDVHGFAIGDRVVIANSAACGACERCLRGRENLCPDLQYLNGAFAEFILIPGRFVQRSVYHLRAALGFERAALSEPLACVLHGISACDLDSSTPGEIAIYGAGPIGLLFVAALARDGHRVLLADPNPSRLAVGARMGATDTLCVARGGGQAVRALEWSTTGEGIDVAVDCTGIAEVWSDAIDSVRPGGLVNLFGGCAPGTTVPLDTHRLHYSEITVKGVYHHRPDTFRAALAMLNDPAFPADALLSARMPIDGVEAALHSMMRKENLKVVICASP